MDLKINNLYNVQYHVVNLSCYLFLLPMPYQTIITLWIECLLVATSSTCSSMPSTLYGIVDLKKAILCVLGEQVMSLKYGFIRSTNSFETILIIN